MIVIIGAGLSGLSAAYHLNDEHIILEKEGKVGGLCKSIKVDGYVFDYAPHILYTKNDYVENLYKELLKNNIFKKLRRAYIYINDIYVEYPFEVNLNALPPEVIEECINGLLNRNENKPKNFEEWIYATFGKGIAKHYMFPYNEKIWKYDLSKMGIDWISGRVVSPSIQEIKQGAAQKIRKQYGQNAEFYYPKYDGIGALANQLASSVGNISLNSEVVEIKFVKNQLKIKYIKEGGLKEIFTKYIISSIPLPDLVKIIDDVPDEVRRAVGSLVHNSLVCVNIGIKRPKIIDKHWLYFPEKEFIFNRVSFPMNFSKFTAPKGRSSILVEVTHRENIVDIDDIKEKTVGGLVDANILKENDIIEVCDITNFKYAYIIYDLEHKQNVNIIHKYLKSKNIIPVGRFGEWEYLNMDKSILSGKMAAIELNEGRI